MDFSLKDILNTSPLYTKMALTDYNTIDKDLNEEYYRGLTPEQLVGISDVVMLDSQLSVKPVTHTIENDNWLCFASTDWTDKRPIRRYFDLRYKGEFESAFGTKITSVPSHLPPVNHSRYEAWALGVWDSNTPYSKATEFTSEPARNRYGFYTESEEEFGLGIAHMVHVLGETTGYTWYDRGLTPREGALYAHIMAVIDEETYQDLVTMTIYTFNSEGKTKVLYKFELRLGGEMHGTVEGFEHGEGKPLFIEYKQWGGKPWMGSVLGCRVILDSMSLF
ncbi:hypothetical protein ACD591_10080 [Rufibacter glacialis]|uniref:Uncharacterized protein n=1 Tax=Rufibacter glacialis TaxID=1259555 RepID=A0A5M8QBK9_9BACT|nr:hypothetical protein [Rufibacter glacialis]KAA6431882.1 hypothetical protein FOE74_17395 [Rufibacter glacialis]GGK80740.1 hypothetical protein GCM10011405_30620 [Rufibacter glacialis]